MTAEHAQRLLIVDDEVAQMRALCDTLQDQGYAVVGVTDGAAALAALRESSFDLLLTDMMMPGMNGIELLRAALQIDPGLAAIVMTGEGTIGSAVEAMQSGALDYMLKPFKLSAILPLLARALAMRRLRLENAALQRRVHEQVAELEAANHELDAFTRSASHDLRTPLSAMITLASLLTMKVGPQLPPEQREWLLLVERSARQMNQLIEDLMRLSHLGRQALKLQAVDMDALARGVLDELRQQTEGREVELQIGKLPCTMADASLVRQVLINLLSNALKFTRKQPRAVIQIGCLCEGDEQVFFVKDNGAGFDMAKAAKLFEAFHRLHRLSEFEGSGVGLSIVQRVVQRHGGRIWAEAAVGQGASLFFTLAPAAAQPRVLQQR